MSDKTELEKEDCPDCEGYGYTVEAECCGDPYYSGIGWCCGIPVPVQEPCNKCQTLKI